MQVDEALLEEWMRRYYFATEFDLGSSGVHPYTFAEVRALTGLTHDEMDNVGFEDSWTFGGPDVRRAVADRFAGGAVDRVMVTHGSSEAIFLSMCALLRAGDEVVVLDPAYQQLHGVATALGCTLRRWHLRFDRGFRPDLDELRELVTRRTRMIVVNFPCNPTGSTLAPQEQRELVAIAARSGCYLVWDGAFTELTYDQDPLPDPGGWYDRTVSFGTLSKAYGLPGLRVGWCLAAPEVLDRCARVRDYVSLHLSPMVELVAERVVRHGDALVGRRRDLATANRAVLAGWIAERPRQVAWVPPAGGVSSFVHLPEVADVEDFCRWLAHEHRILLVPGTCFGHQGHARLGFGAPAEELRRGLDLLGRALDEYRPGAGKRAAALSAG
ncbi:capreomycidine synthase [Kitasatospora sp. NPDC096128]|uniref:capreomycidine synthase n=1 Tax=Kitasatospora sp. NPDC096128 TaxID=3155547 RepID=UPI0033262766